MPGSFGSVKEHRTPRLVGSKAKQFAFSSYSAHYTNPRKCNNVVPFVNPGEFLNENYKFSKIPFETNYLVRPWAFFNGTSQMFLKCPLKPIIWLQTQYFFLVISSRFITTPSFSAFAFFTSFSSSLSFSLRSSSVFFSRYFFVFFFGSSRTSPSKTSRI